MLEKIEQRTKTGQKGRPGEGEGVDRVLRKFGMGKGRLDIDLTESSYFLGDNIVGTLTYELKKPVEGKELWVEVRAIQRVTAPKEVTKFNLRGANKKVVEDRASTLVLYEHRDILDGHHLYDDGCLRFMLPLPSVIASPYSDSEASKSKWFQRVRGRRLVKYTPVKWQVRAKLEIPWSLGISDKRTISVAEKRPVERPQHNPPLPRKAGKNFCADCGGQRGATDKFCCHCGREFE